jgi:hypothetical protein
MIEGVNPLNVEFFDAVARLKATVHLKGNLSSYRQRKAKFKYSKPGFKVVRDLLTKKWIVVKKYKKDPQLRDLIEMILLLETLGVPL